MGDPQSVMEVVWGFGIYLVLLSVVYVIFKVISNKIRHLIKKVKECRSS